MAYLRYRESIILESLDEMLKPIVQLLVETGQIRKNKKEIGVWREEVTFLLPMRKAA
jgi:hypothetical protein